MTRKPKPRSRYSMKTLVACAEKLDAAREEMDAAFSSDGLDRVGAEMILKTIAALSDYYETQYQAFYKPE